MAFQELYDVDFSNKDEVLGSGAFSTVYRCIHKASGQKYAVKVINVEKMKDKEREKIEREAEICILVNHPNIVKLKEFIKEEKKYFLVFELVSGGELFEEIVTRSYYNERDASICIAQILNSLQECHRHRIIHRDLKPENLLLAHNGPDAPVKLTDFGLAVIMKAGPEYFGFAGTPGYLSPEVCKRLPYDTAVDVWACGVILYILLAGYPPFWHDDHKVLYEQIKSGDYSYPSPEWDSVTPSAKELIDRMLELDPHKRITVEDALKHPWVARRDEFAAKIHRQGTLDELKKFNARRKLKGGIRAAMATKRLASVVQKLPGAKKVDARQETVVASEEPANTAPPVVENSAQELEVLAANEKLLNAIEAYDYLTYSLLMDPEVTCFEPESHGVLLEGLPFHKFFFDVDASNRARFSSTVIDPRVKMLSPQSAIVCYSRLVQSEQGGHVQTRRYDETRAWQLKNNKWICVHVHRSS